jgi:polyisoprenoid-binding protein YceI
MRRIMLSALLTPVLFAGFAQPASAQIETYLFDKPHTQIMFFVDHLGFAKSSGKFLDYTGKILWDKGEPEKSSVEVTIPLKSLDMGDQTWNEHTLAKLFQADQYPDMVFKSTAIQKTSDKTANITGDLTLHGVTKPVVLAATFNNAGKHPMMDRQEAGFSATAHLKRSEFGMNEALPMIGDDVEIRIEVEAYQEDKTAAGAENK